MDVLYDKSLLHIVQDLEHLEQIWGLVKEWQTSWDTWKVGTFKSLATEEMGLQAQTLLKNLNKVAREVKVSPSSFVTPAVVVGCVTSYAIETPALHV